jgi:GNAT superfamily N-acetyltransferase
VSKETSPLAVKTDPASSSAVAALEDDPFYRSICAPHEADTARRRPVLAKYFDYSIQEGRGLGRSIHLADEARGVAVWLLPQPPELESQAAQRKRTFLHATLSAEGCANYYRITEFMSAKSATLVDEAAWYLSIVAVDPAAQGQGLGRKLLEPTIAEADRAGTTCYLETFSQRNLSFYQRLGFVAAARFTEPTTGADYAVMVRHPGEKGPGVRGVAPFVLCNSPAPRNI